AGSRPLCHTIIPLAYRYFDRSGIGIIFVFLLYECRYMVTFETGTSPVADGGSVGSETRGRAASAVASDQRRRRAKAVRAGERGTCVFARRCSSARAAYWP